MKFPLTFILAALTAATSFATTANEVYITQRNAANTANVQKATVPTNGSVQVFTGSGLDPIFKTYSQLKGLLAITLADLPQTGATDGQTIVWSDSSGRWIPGTIVGGGGGSTPTGTGFRHVTGGTEDGATKLIDTADINANQVSNAKLAQMASHSFKGNNTGSTANAGDLSISQMRSELQIDLTDNTSDASKPVSTAQATALALKAPLASPTFTGTPAGPTASQGNNSTQFATTAYVDAGLSPKAPLASPTFTGTPAAPTASQANNSTQVATTAYVDTGLGTKAPLSSPTFTGTPAGPTPSQADNSTKLATTAYVDTGLGTKEPATSWTTLGGTTGSQTATWGKKDTVTATGNITLTFAGTEAANSKYTLQLVANGTNSLTFPASYRNGQTRSTSTTLTPAAGTYTFNFQSVDGAGTYLLSDSVGALLNVSTQVTGVGAIVNGMTGSSTPYGALRFTD